MNLYEDLMYRGLIKDVASEDLEKVLNGEPISFYWGTDPTADSLHIGHYSSLITATSSSAAFRISHFCGGVWKSLNPTLIPARQANL